MIPEPSFFSLALPLPNISNCVLYNLLVRQVSDGQQFVSKELQLVQMDPKERAAAASEVQFLKTLQCPYIIKCIDAFNYKNVLHIILEYAWVEKGVRDGMIDIA